MGASPSRDPLGSGSGCGLVAFDVAAAHRAIAACNAERARLTSSLHRRRSLAAAAEVSWRGRYREEFSTTSASLARQGALLDEQLLDLAVRISSAINAARHEALRLALQRRNNDPGT